MQTEMGGALPDSHHSPGPGQIPSLPQPWIPHQATSVILFSSRNSKTVASWHKCQAEATSTGISMSDAYSSPVRDPQSTQGHLGIRELV